MAQALLLPLLEAGLVEHAAVQAAVASPASAERLSHAHDIAVSTTPDQAWRAPMVLLAVKPQQLEGAAAARVADAKPGLLISVLAGVTLKRLQALFPGWQCVRAVPNTPALVRAGLTGLAFAHDVSPEQRTQVMQLFALVGEVQELPEGQLDAFLAHARQQAHLRPRLQQPLDLEELLEIAQAEGFAVSEQDVIAAQLREDEHLSDQELQRRAGEEARRLRTFIPG